MCRYATGLTCDPCPSKASREGLGDWLALGLCLVVVVAAIGWALTWRPALERQREAQAEQVRPLAEAARERGSWVRQ